MKTNPFPDEHLSEEDLDKIGKEICGNKNESHTYECELVTPLFGGGVNSREIDVKMPVRATAIRGQLRFWWRLLKKYDPKNSEELFKEERKIWGGLGDKDTLAKSKVIVKVSFADEIRSAPYQRRIYGQERNRDKYVFNKNIGIPSRETRVPDYALFPARGTNDTEPAQLGLVPFRFTVSLKFADSLNPQQKDLMLSQEQKNLVLKSFRWWAVFGGIGSRTRRGLGSVRAKDNGKYLTVTRKEAENYGCQLILSDNNHNNATSAWLFAVGKLQSFRQAENIGRNQHSDGSKSPAGRSRWPEPDAIRRLTGKHSPEHKPLTGKNIFPRAAFGLPIIFHFKDINKGEPNDTQLLPKGYERMASPLILKPYYDGTWRAACLCLPYKELFQRELELKGLKNAGPIWRENEGLEQDIKPMKSRGTDPISAFLKYFERG